MAYVQLSVLVGLTFYMSKNNTVFASKLDTLVLNSLYFSVYSEYNVATMLHTVNVEVHLLLSVVEQALGPNSNSPSAQLIDLHNIPTIILKCQIFINIYSGQPP